MGIIYKATNSVNGKSFVGTTEAPLSALNALKNKYKADALSKPLLSFFTAAIRRHGWNKFDWEILYQGDDYEIEVYDYLRMYGDYNHTKILGTTEQPAISAEAPSKFDLISNAVVTDYNSGLTVKQIVNKYNISPDMFERIKANNTFDSAQNRINFRKRLNGQYP